MHGVTNVAESVSVRGIVTKDYADITVGSTLLDMRGNKIINLKELTV